MDTWVALTFWLLCIVLLMNMGVQRSCKARISIPLSIYWGGLLNPAVIVYVVVWRTTLLFSMEAARNHFAFPPSEPKSSSFSTSSPVLIFCLFVCLFVQFSHSVVSNSLRPHGLQHTRLPRPSPTPGTCSNSCASSQWCHPTLSSSVVRFSSPVQYFPASGSFPMNQFSASGGPSIGVSASASDLPMCIQDWFLLELTKVFCFCFLNKSSHLNRRRRWHPTPVLLLGKSHGWRRLVGCSPWGLKESDKTEQLHFHFSLSCNGEGNGNPLQCFCLETPREEGAWWAAVYGVAQSWTWLKWLSSSSSSSHLNGCVVCAELYLSPFCKWRKLRQRETK